MKLFDKCFHLQISLYKKGLRSKKNILSTSKFNKTFLINNRSKIKY